VSGHWKGLMLFLRTSVNSVLDYPKQIGMASSSRPTRLQATRPTAASMTEGPYLGREAV